MNQLPEKVLLTCEDDPNIKADTTIPKCVPGDLQINFEFRPDDSYDGSFGFDWMRSAMRGDKMDYKDLLTKGSYADLKDEYGVLKFDWTQEECFQTWMTLMAGQTIKLKLNAFVKLATIEGQHTDLFIGTPEEIEGNISLNTDFFKITPNTISSSLFKDSYKNDQLITITCLREFNTDQQIQVFYIKKTLDSEIPEIVTLGKLNIIKNNKFNKIEKVVFIKVKTSIGNGNRIGSTDTSTGKTEITYLNKYLKQFYTQVDIDIYFNKNGLDHIDLSNDSDFKRLFGKRTPRTLEGYFSEKKVIKSTADLKKDIDKIRFTDPDFVKVDEEGNYTFWSKLILTTYLNYLMKDDNRYKDYIKIYFLDEEVINENNKRLGGFKNNGYFDHKGNNAVITKFRYLQDVTHEFLHANNLKHTFSDSNSTKEQFLFEEKKTFNLMDYDPDNGPHDVRFYSWKRQWKTLNLKLKDSNQGSVT